MKNNKEEMVKTVKIFGYTYEIDIAYKRIKKPNLELKQRQIEINLPNKYKKINNEIIIEMLLEKMYDAIADKELDIIMEKVRTTLKFAPEDYKIMRLDKRLAKRFANRIIISPDIVKYRKEIIEYVIFYEFCRLKINKSSKKLYETIKQYMPNYENYEYELVGVQY